MALPLIAGLLGLGSTSMAILLARYRWLFLVMTIASLVEGFYLNVLRRSTRHSRTTF